MKNWLYIPFLALMAVTYTRLALNYNSEQAVEAVYRGPASIPEQVEPECADLPRQFNPHFNSGNCL